MGMVFWPTGPIHWQHQSKAGSELKIYELLYIIPEDPVKCEEWDSNHTCTRKISKLQSQEKHLLHKVVPMSFMNISLLQHNSFPNWSGILKRVNILDVKLFLFLATNITLSVPWCILPFLTQLGSWPLGLDKENSASGCPLLDSTRIFSIGENEKLPR